MKITQPMTLKIYITLIILMKKNHEKISNIECTKYNVKDKVMEIGNKLNVKFLKT